MANEGKKKMETQTTLDLEKLGIQLQEDGEFGTAGKKTLKAADLGKLGTIKDAAILEVKPFQFATEYKVIMTLNIPSMGKEEDKRIRNLGLNKTNLVTLLNAYGSDTKGWINKMIELRVESTLFQGKKVDAIRVYAKD
jgi:hypothetical protein